MSRRVGDSRLRTVFTVSTICPVVTKLILLQDMFGNFRAFPFVPTDVVIDSSWCYYYIFMALLNKEYTMCNESVDMFLLRFNIGTVAYINTQRTY